MYQTIFHLLLHVSNQVGVALLALFLSHCALHAAKKALHVALEAVKPMLKEPLVNESDFLPRFVGQWDGHGHVKAYFTKALDKTEFCGGLSGHHFYMLASLFSYMLVHQCIPVDVTVDAFEGPLLSEEPFYINASSFAKNKMEEGKMEEATTQAMDTFLLNLARSNGAFLSPSGNVPAQKSAIKLSYLAFCQNAMMLFHAFRGDAKAATSRQHVFEADMREIILAHSPFGKPDFGFLTSVASQPSSGRSTPTWSGDHATSKALAAHGQATLALQTKLSYASAYTHLRALCSTATHDAEVSFSLPLFEEDVSDEEGN